MVERGVFAIVVCFETSARQAFLVARHEERGWELPGGTVEPGESALEAGRREFREEIGHRLEEACLVLEENTPEGVCTVVTGTLGERVSQGEESIEAWRFVSSLLEVEPLAWPEDPYEAIGDALGVDLVSDIDA